MPTQDLSALAEHLERTHITGEVATAREINLAHITGFLEGNEHLEFDVEPKRTWTWDQVFDLMVRRCGINSDRDHVEGQDTIGTELCLNALNRYRRRFWEAVKAGDSILFATGHPAGLFPIYQHMAAAARSDGANVIEIREGIPFKGGDLRQINDVVMFQQYGSLAHTHYPEPMRLVLEQLQDGGGRPDFVVADHGWAGAAASAGIPTIGIADCNDPGLFVSEAQEELEVCVPMDDNVLPGYYSAVIDYILAGTSN
ncbi:phosphatase [Kocuria sp. TGY1127_2]|uniref:phosphatase n=1 Tax=Kocuria sp. TGY1127_2 TaxID=2711328 RepID=UPI0015BD6E4A|nr:phosphatase [Kocuria sp. TGY1127_2]